ncbi:DUF106 domain-containing protein [Candidatus Woesearchaeota archaeon]|nr:MAG: DUF106 domain-containing protein [Candidatus Woesearchaeota archaeon]
MALESIFDPTLGWLLSNLPSPWGLFAVSFLLTLLITLIYKWVTDQELMKTLKEDMKSMQKELKELKDDPQALMAKQKEVMEKNMKYMMHSFKPMLITFIPIILIFGWLRKYYETMGNPDVLFGLSWLWSYIIFSIVLSMFLRKVLKVH